MVVKYNVEGYKNFIKFFEHFKSPNPTFVLYTGSKLETGDSWCPNCIDAQPFIEKGIESAPETYQYIVVEVGDRPFWKDRKCPFKTDKNIRIRVLPTLVRWGTQMRLEGNQLLNSDLINLLLFESHE